MQQEEYFYVYFMMNERNTVVYIGFTSDLIKRVWQHKEKLVHGFTSMYNVTKLVHYELFDDPMSAIQREKEVKGWTRKKKDELIQKNNSNLIDLYDSLI